MEITLTPAQWLDLKGIVAQGMAVERALGQPVEVINGEIKIEVNDNKTIITLADEE